MEKKMFGLIVGLLFIGLNAFAADGDLIVNGKVGIGTTSPIGPLTVNANTSGSDRADQFVIQGRTNGNLKFNLGIQTDASPPYANIGFVEEQIAWRNIVLARNGGNVGIGTATPTHRLHINTNQDDTSLLRLQTSGSRTGIGFYADSGSTTDWELYNNYGDFVLNNLSTVPFYIIGSNGNVGIKTDTVNNILTVLQASPTDPIADSWTVHPCDRTTKDVIRTLPNQSGALDQLLDVELYEWKRKPLVSDFEVKGLSEKAMEADELEKKRQELSAEKSKLPKFQTKRLGLMLDDPNIPEEIISVDGAGKKGIDLVGYIGWLHATIKELALRVQELEKR